MEDDEASRSCATELERVRVGIARRYARSLGPAEAEDLASEAIAIAIRDHRRYDPDKGTGEQWMAGIARNVANTRHRRNSTQERALKRLPVGLESADTETTALNHVDAIATLAVVAAAIHRLPGLDRHVLNVAISAALMGGTAGLTAAQQVRLHRVREGLRKAVPLIR